MKLNSLIDPKRKEEFHRKLLGGRHADILPMERKCQRSMEREAEPLARKELGLHLWTACYFGELEKAKRLIKSGVDINFTKDGWTPLLLAAKQNNEALVELLLKNGANALQEFNIGGVEFDIETAVEWSEENRTILDLIRKYAYKQNELERGDFTSTYCCDGDSLTQQLRKAIINSDLNTARNLLSAGAPANARGDGQGTLITLAVDMGNTEILTLLINNGANVNEAGLISWHPLTLAVCNNSEEIVRILLDAGADPNVLEDCDRSPLCYAAMNDNRIITELLLDYGAFIDHLSGSNTTPLMYAASAGYLEEVRVLASCGAGLFLRNTSGKNARDQAAEAGHYGVVHFLDDIMQVNS